VNGNTAVYDGENRQTSVTEAPAFGGGTETYVYDGNGDRVEKTGPNGTTVYVYDVTGQLAAEYATAAAQNADCATCYLSHDHLGSVRLVTSEAGTVIARHDYLPFGEEMDANAPGRDGNWGPANDSINQKFTGKERDAESGLDYFGARYCGSALGRFTSPDKPFADQHVASPQSWNLYTCTLNNPLRYVDDNGEGVLEGISKWVDRTGGAFVSLVLEPDKTIPAAASNVWNAVMHPGQTVSNISIGIQNFINSSTDDKITTLTGVALDVGVVALTGGAARVAEAPTTLSELPALANAQNAVEATAAVTSGKTATVVGAYDVQTGAVAVGRSGAGLEPVNPQIAAVAEKAGGLGARNPGVRGPVGNCAECNAANTLANQGSNVTDVRFTQAVRPRTREVVPKCPNCEKMFPDQ